MKLITLEDGSQLYELDLFEVKRSITELVKEENPGADRSSIENRSWKLVQKVKMESSKAAREALNSYRSEVKNMSRRELVSEKHNSKLLGKHLFATGSSKPAKEFEAHAIISGGSEYARSARIILARYGIRIDDPVNGVWLPNFKKNVPHNKMPNAPAHRTIHTPQYYVNLLAVLVVAGSKEEVPKTLSKVRKRLTEWRFPYQKHSRINERNW